MASSEILPDTASRKRKIENEESADEGIRKFLKTDPDPLLLDLADEVLMEILVHLDSESLISLGLTCSHFKQLIEEKKLWTHISFNSKDLTVFEIFKRLRKLKMTTRTLKLKGNCKPENIEQRPMPNKQTFKDIIKKIAERSPLIQNLIFNQICFDWTKDFSITKFPANLKVLSFQNCIMPKSRKSRMMRTFTGIVEHIPNLEEIRLEYCNFFESNDVMPFSKLQFLKTLSLRGCLKMKNCVPYLSLACRFGFPKLEILDLRETNIGDGEVQCLNAIKTLKQLFLERPQAFARHQSLYESDDDDFQMLFRAGRATVVGRLPLRALNNSNGDEGNAPNPRPSSSNGAATNGGAPSTSTGVPTAVVVEIVEGHQDGDNDDSPSSPESYSPSISSDESLPDQPPPRTIIVRANIGAGFNALNPREPQIELIDDGIFNNTYNHEHARRIRNRIDSISDRGILGFGVPRPNIRGNLIFFGQPAPDPNFYLERIVLRNFEHITDTTLVHLETNAPRLIFLDVTGCSQVTRDGVQRFRNARTGCEVISDHTYEAEE